VVTAEAPLLDSSLDDDLEPLEDSVLEVSVLVVGVLSAVEESVLVEAVEAFVDPVLVLALAARLALATRAGSWPEASCT
jgi:hypothetical protein